MGEGFKTEPQSARILLCAFFKGSSEVIKTIHQKKKKKNKDEMDEDEKSRDSGCQRKAKVPDDEQILKNILSFLQALSTQDAMHHTKHQATQHCVHTAGKASKANCRSTDLVHLAGKYEGENL